MGGSRSHDNWMLASATKMAPRREIDARRFHSGSRGWLTSAWAAVMRRWASSLFYRKCVSASGATSNKSGVAAGGHCCLAIIKEAVVGWYAQASHTMLCWHSLHERRTSGDDSSPYPTFTSERPQAALERVRRLRYLTVALIAAKGGENFGGEELGKELVLPGYTPR